MHVYRVFCEQCGTETNCSVGSLMDDEHNKKPDYSLKSNSSDIFDSSCGKQVCLDCGAFLLKNSRRNNLGWVKPEEESAIDGHCSACGSANIRKWDGTTCPKCGGTMQRVLSKIID